MPAQDRFEIHIPVLKLLIGLLVTLLPISLAGLYSITQADKSLERTIGNHFKTLAENNAASVSQYIHDCVVRVGVIAVDPVVMDAVTAANRAYQGMADPAVAAKIEKIDKTWNTPSAEPIVKEMLSSRASHALQRQRELDSRFLRITVADSKGAAVAATHKTLDYYQGDEEYWQNIYAQGRGAIGITDILYDEATKSHYIGIGVPVMEEGSNRFIGTVDALVDVSTLFPIVNRTQLGPTGRALLVKDDGTVIAGTHVDLSMRLKSDELAAVQDALASVQGRELGYVVAPIRDAGQTLIGFADTSLKRDFQNLAWSVLICQSTREVFAPIRTVGRLIAFMSLLGLGMVALLGAYFIMHRKLVYTGLAGVPSGPPAETPAATAKVAGR